MEAGHRSIHPNIPSVPWWGAVLMATTATAAGYAIDAGSGHKELTHVFAGLYLAGCVAAVLAVRRAGVFTAVIQPPLILFCAVPGAYWLFHGGNIGNLKDLLINCGYPLIERFPLMLGTVGVVLLIGLIRWYFGSSNPSVAGTPTKDSTATTRERTSIVGGLAAKLTSVLGRDPDDTDDEASSDSQPARSSGRSRETGARTSRAGDRGRSAKRTTARARPARQLFEDNSEPIAERPRRHSRRGATPARDLDAADPPRRARRRQRPQSDPDLRAQPPREMRRDPHPRRSQYDRPSPRGSRFDPYDLYEAPNSGPAESFGRRYGPSYQPYDSYEPPRRRATPTESSSNPTHHPISRVRYRGETPSNELRDK